MGRFEEFAKQIVQKYLDKEVQRDRAYAKAKTRVHKAIVEYDERIDEILDRFMGKPPKEWYEHIGHLTQRKCVERELLNELEDLDASGWPKSEI
jgi:hypothetical protein